MHEELARLAARQHGVVSWAQAAALGLGREALRHAVAMGRWERVSRRVSRAAGAPRTWHQAVFAAVLDAGPHAVASHLTAARLWRLPGFVEEHVHVTVPHPRSHRRSALATLHLTVASPEDAGVVAGIPVTSPTRTVFDLVGCVSSHRLARAVDNVVAMRLTTYAQLCAVRDRLCVQGRDGSTRFRGVIEGRDASQAAPESELERRFLQLVRRYGLPEPEPQVVLGTNSGRIGRVDFLFRAANLVVELDGARHHTSLLDREEDARRDLALLRGGRRVVRLTWHQVRRQPAEVASALADVLSRAA